MKLTNHPALTPETQAAIDKVMQKRDALVEELAELEEQLAQAEDALASIEDVFNVEESDEVDKYQSVYLPENPHREQTDLYQLFLAEENVLDLEDILRATKAETEKVEHDLKSYADALVSKRDELAGFTQTVKEGILEANRLDEKPGEWKALFESCTTLLDTLNDLTDYVDSQILAMLR